MTAAAPPAGYWPSPWPGEDGGPARRQVPHGSPGLDIGPGESLDTTFRLAPVAVMPVLRDPGEVYFLTCSGPGDDTTMTLERIDPESLEPVATTGPVPTGPFWPGGVAAHADGSLVDAARPITIGDVLAHTSGLTYDFMIDNPAAALYREHQVMHDATRTLGDVIDLIASLPLAFQPGERFHYSVGIDVAARLIEVLADQPLGEFLAERMFGPLGMVDTGFGVPDDRLDRLSAVYGLPDLVGKDYHLTDDPKGCAICGISSGGN